MHYKFQSLNAVGSNYCFLLRNTVRNLQVLWVGAR